MKRKIVLHGKTSLTVSLPIKWVKRYNLEKGDEIDVSEQGNRLVISTDKDMEVQSKTIDVRELDELTHKAISALYKSGYDEIELLFDSQKQLDKVREIISQDYIGFGIVEEHEKYIKAKKISSIHHEEFSSLLKRLFYLIISAGDDAIKAIENYDKGLLRQVVSSDTNINKITDFCRRALNKRDDPNFRKNKPLYYIIEELERIGDIHKEICSLILKDKAKFSADFIEIYKRLNLYFREFYEAFYKFSLQKMEEFAKKRHDISHRLNEMIDNATNNNLRIAMLLSNYFESIYSLNGPLMVAYL